LTNPACDEDVHLHDTRGRVRRDHTPAAATAGCGGAHSPPAVQLALTAPKEGATVEVQNIKVFGTVDPAS
jgi:hypothetical protein